MLKEMIFSKKIRLFVEIHFKLCYNVIILFLRDKSESISCNEKLFICGHNPYLNL